MPLASRGEIGLGAGLFMVWGDDGKTAVQFKIGQSGFAAVAILQFGRQRHNLGMVGLRQQPGVKAAHQFFFRYRTQECVVGRAQQDLQIR